MLLTKKLVKRYSFAFLFSGVIILWILSLKFLTLPLSTGEDDEALQKVEKLARISIVNTKHVTNPPLLAVVILQLSAVRSQNQGNRLKVIDSGWAKWTKLTQPKGTKGSTINIKVVAPVSAVGSSIKLSAIDVVPAADTVMPNPTPFHRLVHSLLHAIDLSIVGGGGAKWVVLANDHSFIIPQNLRRFLSLPASDPEKILYSGNKLGLNYNKSLLYFASGGAGATLSHVTAKFIVLLWMLLSDDSSLLKLLSPANDIEMSTIDKNSVVCLEESVQLTVRSQQGNVWSVANIATLLRKWVNEVPAPSSTVMHTLCSNRQSSDNIHTIKVVLSSSVSIAVRKGALRGDFQVTLHHTDRVASEPRVGASLTRAQLRKACLPVGKWGNDNPGILLANCLAKFLDHPFTPSCSSEVCSSQLADASREGRDAKLVRYAERFNVYGPLRTLLGDFDSWYVDAKKLAEDGLHNTNSNYSMYALAKDIVSFHYVSEIESRLLYLLLGPVNSTSLLAAHTSYDTTGSVHPLCQGPNARDGASTTSLLPNSIAASTKTLNEFNAACSTWQDLLKVWPRTDAEAGDYSRRLGKGDKGQQEAKALFAFLSEIAWTMRS